MTLRSLRAFLLAAAATAAATFATPLAARAVTTQVVADTTHATAAVNAAAERSLKGDTVAQPAEHEKAAASGGDIIMPHITDSHHIEVPWFSRELGKEIELPRWAPVQVGGVAIDLSPTKHVVMLVLASLLCALVLITAARAHTRHSHAVGRPQGFAAGVEATVLFVRDEVILKNVGHHGEGFVPYLLSLFFFILFANVLGLIPYGSTATGNIAVTATLAVVSFLVIEIAGMRALGREYIGTIIYWPSDMKNGPMKLFLSLILSPVELLGKFTKPFALAIRLFANMTAGHVIVLAFIGMIFTFGSWFVVPGPLFMALAIMCLEVFVALLQAYIFTLLVSVFIGQLREAHH